MKGDLIFRSALLEALKTEEGAAILGNSHVRFLKAKTLIEKIPAVEAVEPVEPVQHGRWVDRYDGKYANPLYECSECKEKALYKYEVDVLDNGHFVQALSNACPHCRAKMDGDGDDQA